MNENATQPDSAPQLEGGTYEILRNRLRGHGEELRRRLGRLNEERKAVFGSIELKLLNTERVTTEHNCIPRDMVAVDHQVILGYNVHFGLKAERNLADVFAVYAFDPESKTFTEQPLDLLANPQFQKDFQDVYRYYKDAVFAKFFVRRPYLYMVFQVGRSTSDIKSFKWLFEGDSLRYLDNRSDHEVKYPPQHEFEWRRTTRDMQQHGEHPHVSIEDRVFVETVGGDLTVKIENNTDSGEGIYAEPVENPDQTLDDADIQYAIVGNIILLKIRPYQESKWRYIVYNEKIQQARRIDAIEDSCVLLPDDHGLIFSKGYYLQSGEYKLFDTDIQGLVFERRIASPNGEDTLFVFYQPEQGTYVLLGYNVINQVVETPVICHGFTRFEGGEMPLFRGNEEPQKHHAIQVWQTPYTGESFKLEAETDSYLYKIGNRDIVRGMAECHEILNLVEKEDTYAGLYVDLAKLANDVLDSYFWINHEEAANLGEPLRQVRDAARAAVDEFEKVVRVRQNTEEETKRVAQRTREVLNEAGRRRFDHIDAFVKSLADLRSVRGEIIGLKDLRYIDLELVEKLEQEVSEAADRLSHRCVEFLLSENSLKPYEDAVRAEHEGIEQLAKVADAKQVDEKIAASAAELEMLIEIVSNLKIDDATKRTTIIDNVSAIFSQVNTARAALKRKIQELGQVEGAAEFSSQLKLLSQSVVNYLDVCDTPEKCEEYLTRLLVQIEELEGKFAEFDEFIVELAEKREEVSTAFETRRMQLVERRNKRAGALAQAADRILKGVKTRVESLPSINEIHGYFASDLMIEKVRDIVRELEGLGDSVKVDDIQSRLKTIREDAVRQLKDRQELFVEGENVIRFGKHRFSVNTQPLDLTTVLRNGRLCYHLTGTEFYEPIESEELEGTRDVWEMEVLSENREVYRAEYLAYKMLIESRKPDSSLRTSETLPDDVQRFMSPRYREGYSKGVHDHDAALILQALLEIDAGCGLLRYSSRARALAGLFWWYFGDSHAKRLMEYKLTGFGAVVGLFPGTRQQRTYVEELREMLGEFVEGLRGGGEVEGGKRGKGEEGNGSVLAGLSALGSQPLALLLDEAAEYLFAELTSQDRDLRAGLFVVSRTAADLCRRFHEFLHNQQAEQRFAETMKSVKKDNTAAFGLARDWLAAFVAHTDADSSLRSYLDEAALLLMDGNIDERAVVDAELERDIPGLVGTHPVIREGTYRLGFNEFMDRLNRFERQVIPRFERYHELKSALVERAREAMKLSEFQPKVLTSFVRNRLIDQVYLPIVGDNLAKQIGSAGEGKRTDRSGLLLVISPPGYGKTTLMEYIANRLGIIFMKINGPSLGHEVTSLDPAAAPNAGAREEIEKLSLAFEMGDNVMLYLDDIQHCHPEFLQKFISLCDAQRRVEGVWKGRTRTYDFRGKKMAVVMAGNPYTESGEKFRIPDMLANRADIYNLGEIIGDSAEAFKLSYLENALTSNPVLGKLAARSQKDVYGVVKLAERMAGDPSTLNAERSTLNTEGIDFEGNYSMEELNEFVSCMAKLMRVRDVVLRVNQEYIASAAQHDDYRTEPPFLLQGSYRNMNRIAEKVLPVMNEEELESLIVTSYQNDAQTLTTGTEANLLKFKQLLGIQTEEERQRWEDIQRTFRQNVRLRGIGTEDKVGQVIATLTTFTDGLESIRKAVAEGVRTLAERDEGRESRDERAALLESLSGGLTALTRQLDTGLAQLVKTAERPIHVDVPPVEVPPIELNWPEHLPLSGGPTGSAPGLPSVVSGFDEEHAPQTPDRITIVNRLPRTVYNVLESQFQLMEQWLKPLTELTTRQHDELTDLRPMIEECLTHYQRLLHKLEEAHERTGTE
jgi:hypothetical protein